MTESTLKPTTVSQKRVVNGFGDINQLMPLKYTWAWEFFLNGNKNHWTPTDVNMLGDVNDYHHKLTPAERHVFENVLAYLTTSDIMAMRNIGLAVMEKMTAPELQIYQARQVFDEAVHTQSYQHCIETIGLDQSEIYNRYRVIPEIHAKIKFSSDILNPVIGNHDLTLRTNLLRFVKSYIFFAAIFEGSWFYNGFSPIFSLQRRRLMRGTSEMLQYIMRDETLHASFGIRTVRQLLTEEHIAIQDIQNDIVELFIEAGELEHNYSKFLLPTPIPGYSSDDHFNQYKFVANRRALQLGMTVMPYPGAKNALPWLDEQANVRKEKNFFETRVTEYQTGSGLSWD